MLVEPYGLSPTQLNVILVTFMYLVSWLCLWRIVYVDKRYPESDKGEIASSVGLTCFVVASLVTQEMVRKAHLGRPVLLAIGLGGVCVIGLLIIRKVKRSATKVAPVVTLPRAEQPHEAAGDEVAYK